MMAKSRGFYAIFGRNAQDYVAIGENHWVYNCRFTCARTLDILKACVKLPKHVENDGIIGCSSPKVVGFTPYLAEILKTMVFHSWESLE